MKAVKILYDQLSPEALEGVVEEFVTRDGTDYGEREVPLEIKINQVMNQLRTGAAVIVFDSESETCNIFKANDPVLNGII
nr:YheU family protein [uncultured Desulfobacter sp.]